MRWLATEFAWALVDDVAAGGLMLWKPPENLWPRIAPMMRRDARLPMDLADAPLVLLAKRLGHGRTLATDECDLRTYR
jgi:predicted nucleic acid-binding protein